MSRLLLGLAVLIPALAQNSSLSGIVRHPQSGAISGAVVSLTHLDTATPRKTLTTPAGRFVFPALPPGHYTLETRMPGFRSTTRQLRLLGDTPLTVNVQLEAAPASGTLSVLGQLPGLSPRHPNRF